MDELKQISCSPECGFLVRSYNEDEIIDMAFDHMKHVHKDRIITKNDIKEDIEIVTIEVLEKICNS